MSDDYVFDSTKGHYNDAPDPTEAAESALCKVVTLDLGAAGTAGNDGTESGGVWVSPNVIEILDVALATATGVTASDTNYATFTVYSRTSAGATQTAIATAATTTTGTGNVVARSKVALSVVAGKSRVAANSILTCNSIKTASGVATGAGTITIRYREVGV